MTKPFEFITADGLTCWVELATDAVGVPFRYTECRAIILPLRLREYREGDIVKPQPTREYEREWTGRAFRFVEKYRGE